MLAFRCFLCYPCHEETDSKAGGISYANTKRFLRHHHFHAYYGEDEATFTLDGEILAGSFPRKQTALVKAWALVHEDDLKANWSLALNGENTFRIDPLR